MGGQVSEVIVHLVVDMFSRSLEERLVKVAISHLAGQVAECREVSVRDGDHAIQQCAEGLLSTRSQSVNAMQTPFKNAEYWRDLLLHPLVGLADPEQAFFQLG